MSNRAMKRVSSAALFVALGAGPNLAISTHANASVITVGQVSGNGVVLEGNANEERIAYTANPTEEALVSFNVDEFAVLDAAGSADITPAGLINFQNRIVGTGQSTNGAITTSILQTVTNTTGAQQNVNFKSLINAGSIGLWVPDFEANGCGIGTLIDCPEKDVAGPPPSFNTVGGPATTGIRFEVEADGVTVFEIDLDLQLAARAPGQDVLTANIADGTRLANFQQAPGVTDDGLFYTWDDTALDFDLGMLDIDDVLQLEFSITSFIDVSFPCVSSDDCIMALAGLGDPIGGGMTGSGGAQRFARFVPTAGPFELPEVTFTPATTMPPAPMPVSEPASLGLLALGTGLLLARRRKRA